MASGMLVVMDRRGGGDEERKVADECEKGSSRDRHGSRVIAEKKKNQICISLRLLVMFIWWRNLDVFQIC